MVTYSWSGEWMINIRNLTEIRNRDPRLGEALIDIQTQTIDANVQSPPQVASISVTGADGVFQVTIVDLGTPAIAINYFVEYDTDQNFPTPHVLDLGASRTWRGYLGNLTLFWRAYSQYVPPYNNQPSPPLVFGNPTAVVGGGSAGPTLPASTGSGTNAVSGQQGGGGFGRNPVRNLPL